MKKTFESKSGSALLVTLLVVSLLLVVVVTFSAYVRLELRAVNARMELIQARQNAKLAMHLALARLQETAGPDQRVTANAAILDENIPALNQHISGVWNTEDLNADPVWLISNPPGLNFDPASTLITENQSALLLAPGNLGEGLSVNDQIRAPLVNIPNLTPSNQQASYAYWISDEGVKASIVPIFQAELVLNQDDLDPLLYERLVRQRSSVNTGRPDFAPESGQSLAQAQGLDLARRNDLPLAWSSSPVEQRNIANSLDETFHDFTDRTYGLLTNTVEGGFRHDLSSIQRLSPNLDAPTHSWINAAVLEGLNLWSEVELGTIQPRMIAGTNQPTDPSLKITPIISEFFLGTALSGNAASASSDEVFIYYLFFAELWNPFTAPLDFSPRGTYEDILVRVSGLPTVNLTNETRGTTREIEIPPLILDLDFYDYIDGSQTSRFEPGRMTWTGNPGSSGGGSVIVEGTEHLRRNGVYIVSNEIGTIPGTTVEDFTGVFSETDLTLEFFIKGTSFDHATDPHVLFWTLELNGYEEFEIDYIGGSGTPTLYTGNPSQFFRPRNTKTHGVNRASINQSRNSFNYWMRINEDLFSPGNDDFREMISTNAIQRNRTSINIQNENPDSIQNIYDFSEFPEVTGRNTAFSALDFYSAKDSSFDINHERWAYLIDLPERPPVELAQLNFLVFSEDIFEKIGYTNTSDLNSIYDRYFMSGLTDQITPTPLPGTLTPNPRYRIVDNTAFDDFNTWAGDLFVVGAFNVNSTSPKAWAEVLTGSDLEQWPTGTDTNSPELDLESAWFSMTDYGSRMFDEVFSGVDNFRLPLRNDGSGNTAFSNFVLSNIPQNTALPPAFRQGFREIKKSDRILLGEEISKRILARERPFISIQEFFDSGILHQAIQEIPGLNSDSSDNPIPGYSPAYFSQVTIAQNLGSRLSTRSDTFQIFSYGHVENSVTGERTESRCMAVVQRVPTRSELDGLPSLTEREFVIQEFKWLD